MNIDWPLVCIVGLFTGAVTTLVIRLRIRWLVKHGDAATQFRYRHLLK